MAQTYQSLLSGVDSLPVVKASAIDGYEARVRRFRAVITLASQASGDTIVLADIPAGFLFAGGEITSSASLGTATVAVGNSTSAGKYRAAAVFTATDTPTNFGTAATLGGSASSAAERVILTVGTAALPSSGTLVVDLYFSHPN
jgi:hypothetical protein